MKSKIEKLDRRYSRAVRKINSTNGYLNCFVCDKTVNWKQAQCAHYMPRANMATRFHHANCQPCCHECNTQDPDHRRLFRSRLVEAYGEDTVKWVEKCARKNATKSAIQDAEDLIELLENIVAEQSSIE